MPPTAVMGMSQSLDTQAGCYLYGTLRETDFLPVGPEQPDEQLYRGAQSESVSGSDDRGSEDSHRSLSWNRMSDESEDESEEAVSRGDDQSEVSSDESKCQRRRQNDFDVSDQAFCMPKGTTKNNQTLVRRRFRRSPTSV